MAFSKAQERTAWCSFAVMAGMLLLPPWVWMHDSGTVLLDAETPYYSGLWDMPGSFVLPGAGAWHATIWWPRLVGQWLIVAIGMLLLLFLREARERDVSRREPHGEQPGCASPPGIAAAPSGRPAVK